MFSLFIVPSLCNNKRDLKDSNGNYQKTVCTVYQDKTYVEAVAMCSASGMKIFNAESVESVNAVISYSTSQYPFGTFWVEGKNGTVCSAIADVAQPNFLKTNSVLCTTKNYFNCEYICKFSNKIINHSTKYACSNNSCPQ